MDKKPRVAVMLSGGVDSSVAAYLLKEQGYEVIGVFMKNWHDDTVTLNNECPWVEDSTDALLVAQKLDIPYYVYDFSQQYKARIVDYMFAEYQAGRTPNPDVLCNREIKFDVFLKAAEKLQAQMVATGHYCRKDTLQQDGKTWYRLLAGADGNKDQSYFLCQLNQQQLAKVLFPIGHLQKPRVREIALEQDLVTAGKKDSQGLCFVGKVRLPDFLQQQLKPKKGPTIMIPEGLASLQRPALPPDMDWSQAPLPLLETLCRPPQLHPEDGTVAGEHNGAHYFTVGQRKGLNIGGMPKGVFVIGTDTRQNILYAGLGDDHPALLREGLKVEPGQVHWIRPDRALQPGQTARYLARIRYRQPLSWATLIMRPQGLFILFDQQQKGVAAGQFVAWYQDEECVGSGTIAG
ncbi:MAG: tRNA 2-thiouridine(34) synthase MnmA [Bacteroidales bacterium]